MRKVAVVVLVALAGGCAPPATTPGTPPHETTGRDEATVLHRGPALWILFSEERGPFGVGFEAGAVDVRQEMCQVMGLCYQGS